MTESTAGEKKPIALTGIKPTGTPHLGNYLGSIQPALSLMQDYRCIFFIADYHALTTVKDKKAMQQQIRMIAATWLALGLDPERVIFFQQSRVPEIFELAWILSCFTPKGLLNRAHAFKAALDQNKAEGRDPEEGINAGVYNYPVLMAADILAFGSNLVPVGLDQKQHIEIARDIAQAVNHVCGNVLAVPEPLIREEVKVIPGLDGRKMSKNYDNVLPIFEDPAALKKRVMRIVTDSKRPEDPKNPDECNVFNIFRHFASAERVEEVRRAYAAGGVGYGDMKKELADVLVAHCSAAREKYDYLLNHPDELERLLDEGSQKARSVAMRRLEKIRLRVGVR